MSKIRDMFLKRKTKFKVGSSYVFHGNKMKKAPKAKSTLRKVVSYVDLRKKMK